MALRQEHKHKQRIQGNIQQPSQDNAGAGFPGAADAADQIGQHIGKHCGNAAHDNYAQGILPCISIGVLPGTQQLQHRLHKNGNADCKQRGNGQRQIQGKGAHPSGFLLTGLAQQTGNQGSAACPRQPRQTEGDVEHRQDQGCGRHHVGVICLPHKKGIRHVVDQNDQLAGHRRNNHFSQGGWHREILKHIFLCRMDFCLHHTTPELSGFCAVLRGIGVPSRTQGTAKAQDRGRRGAGLFPLFPGIFAPVIFYHITPVKISP